MEQRLTERYIGEIRGELSCFDRVVITGMIPQIGYAEAMTAELWRRKIRVFDYPRFAEPLRDEIRHNAERLARENDLEIEFIRRRNFRKEQRVKEIITEQLGVSADQVTDDASFIDDLGADSLDQVELVMDFEDKFDVEIPDEAAEGLRTVGAAVEYLEKKIAEKESK